MMNMQADQIDLITEQGNVRLYELDESGLYYVEYANYAGRVVTSPLMPYSEAEANFCRRVEEEDYR